MNGALGTLLMCPDNSRKNPNMLRLVTSTRTARVTIAVGDKLTSPPFPRKKYMKTADIIRIGTVTVSEKVDAISVLRRDTHR